MTMRQHIVVCTEDAVLAKKVRFLLARDECEVEIVGTIADVEARIRAGDVSLVVLSRQTEGGDAIATARQYDASMGMPTTIILGGAPEETAPFIRLIPDPIDTQAIYRIASDALADAEAADDDLTAAEVDLSADDPTRLEPAPAAPEPVDLQPEIYDEATALDAFDSNFADAEPVPAMGFSDEPIDAPGFEATPFDDSAYQIAPEPPMVEAEPDLPPPMPAPREPSYADLELSPPPGASRPPAGDNLGLAGVLDPARFAKVLYQCWTMEARGALIVAGEAETLTIYFEGGSPVHIESNIPGQRIGATMVAKNRMTDAQYSEAAKLAVERGMTIGNAIVECGYLARESLGREMGEDARERIVSQFACDGGAFEFEPNRPIPTADRPYRIPVGRILVEGLKQHADDATIDEISPDGATRYFKLVSQIDELSKRFPLTDAERRFLEFSGRAYNVNDASSVSGLELRAARVLMALLETCEEVEPFTPGVLEFESRLAEERARASEPPRPAPPPRAPPPSDRAPTAAGAQQVKAPSRPPVIEMPAARPPPDMATIAAASEPTPPPAPPPLPKAEPPPPAPAVVEAPPPPPPVAPPPPPAEPPPVPAAAPPPPEPAAAPPAAVNPSIPPMPVPPKGQAGKVPRPVVFSPPLPRGADGQPQETAERTRSREHFQRGVTLLGQGNFDEAEEAFREAIALCSEEHVYLIGLARAIYYNPIYGANGKVPVLRSIVDRASYLAPGDGRVGTLNDWVKTAEAQVSG